jgi:hypothetical protein
LWFSASKQESHRAVALVLITGMNDTSRKDVKVMDLLPTPGARDGDRGPRSDQAVLENTGQRSLLDIVKLLAIESGELKVKLLPTPRVSDSKGVDNETEWARHSPGLAAMSFHLRSDDDQAGRDDEKLFSAPQARDWKGVPGDTYNSHNLARDISRLVAEEDVLLLPTPRATRGGSATETLNLLQPIPEQTEKLPMLPTPKASDGVFGRPRTSGRPIEKSTHLQTIVTLLPTQRASGFASDSQATHPNGTRKSGSTLNEAVALPDAVLDKDLGENVDNILPTPKTHQRGDCPSERERNSPDLAAVTHHFPVEEQPQAIPVLWGKYEPAVRRWEKLTRPAPIPTEPNKNGNPRLAAPFSEWMMGWPEGWVTDPEIGLPRTAQLKIIGNGVCPQQAYSAITELLSIHASEEKMIQ